LLRWLLVDGYGFHEGFFHHPRYLAGQLPPARLRGYARRVFDQGLGRCLWFIEGTDVRRIGATIQTFARERHSDLWSGVGLASVYAGELNSADLRALCETAGHHLPELAQGAAFAAKARLRAGNPTPYTDVACRAISGTPARKAAQITDLALENLPATGPEPAYEVWRRRIQARFAQIQEPKT
jgi:enediyne biosynthesis protein E3